MKFTIDTSSFSRELFKVMGIAGSKSTMPILHNALLEAHDDGSVTIAATDNELTVVTRASAGVESPGRVTVRAKDLYDVVKGIRSESVNVERADDGLGVLVVGGTRRARLVGMDPAEYPSLPRIEGVTPVKVPTTKLLRVIDRVLPSISTDEGRPNLTGAFTRLQPSGAFSMVSTDGHRLSQAGTRVPGFDGDPGPLANGIIIPRKGLAELRRTVDTTEPEVEISTKGSSIVFAYGNTRMYVRLIDGTFPNFAQVIPVEKPERRAIANRSEMLSTIKAVSQFSSAKTNNVRLSVEGDALSFFASSETGELDDNVHVQYSGKPVKAGYNYRFLVDVLSVLSCEKVSVEIIDTLSPTILHELEGEDGDESLFIVMPMRI
jgi:DNA polymerase-3 subunit beta